MKGIAVSATAIGIILVLAFVAAGTLVFILARPLANLGTWWESLWIDKVGLKFLSAFRLEEDTAVVLLRVIGVAFWLVAVLIMILIIVLPYMTSD